MYINYTSERCKQNSFVKFYISSDIMMGFISKLKKEYGFVCQRIILKQ